MEEVMRTFKTRIVNLSNEVINQFARGFGTRRFIYNWLIEEMLINKERGTNYTFDTKLNKLIREKPTEFGWIKEVNTMIKTNSLQDCYLSISHYYKELHKARKIDNEVNINKYKPHWKSRDDANQSFRLNSKWNGTFKVVGSYTFETNWTKSYGRIKLHTRESLDFLKHDDIKIKTITVSKTAGRYYLSIAYSRTKNELRQHKDGVIGLDFGVKHLFTSYDGLEIVFRDGCDLAYANKQIAKWNRKFARKLLAYKAKCKMSKDDEKPSKSNNYYKCLTHLQHWYEVGANKKKDYFYKLATYLCENYSIIKIDDFSYKQYLEMNRVKGITGRHDRIRKLNEVSICMFRDILEYTASKYGVQVLYVPKGTPTTQTCSQCGELAYPKLTLSDRKYHCKHCGFDIDRDANSAINVYKLLIN